MSVAEIKQAVKALAPEELAEISAFVADCEAEGWSEQIDRDFAPDGRLHAVLKEVREDLRAGRLGALP